MNLMIIIPEMNRGGAEKIVALLANRIVNIKEDSVSILVYGNSKPAYTLNPNIKYINLNLSSIELKLKFPVIWKIHRNLIDNSIDVVLGFSTGVSKIIPIASVGICCRTIGSERSNPYNRSDNKFRRLITNVLFSCLDGIIFTTKGCCNYYNEKVRRKSVIIPNGYEKKIAHSEPCLRRSDRKDIIAVGNLRKVKDYPTMIKAFSIFATKHHDFSLHIYGEGIEEKRIQNLINEYKLQKKVFLHGSINDLTKIYRSCRFLVHSSRSESWCNAILEALSFGVPCIAADCDFGPREMIRSGFNGYLYEVGNAEELAYYMELLAEDKGLLDKMSFNARQDAKQFEFESIFNRYYDFILKDNKK